MKTFVFAVFAICLFIGCDKQPEPEKELPKHKNIIFWEDQRRVEDNLWYVCYGMTYEKTVPHLAFVCFEKGNLDSPPDTSPIESRTISHKEGKKEVIDRHEGWLITGPGPEDKIQLPTETQLYEIQSGKIVTIEERVTLDQLKQFLESQPQDYSIKALLDFAKQN